jgi:hypothetical protein
MKNVLIIDDDEIRHEAFDKIYVQDNVEHAYSYFEFLEKLPTYVWDIICFDHDLCIENDGDTYIDGKGQTREYTGYQAALKVCEMEDSSLPKLAIVHSMNPSGADSIAKLLRRRGIDVRVAPFNAMMKAGT